MPKTLALLLVTLIVSVLGIAVAYLVGLQTAELRMQSAIDRSREEQRALVDELRRDLAPRPVEVAAAVPSQSVPPAVESEEEPEPPAHKPAMTAHAVVPAEVKEQKPADSETAAAAIATEPDSFQPVTTAPVDTPAVLSLAREEPEEQTPPMPPVARTTFETVALGTPYADVAQRFGREGLAALTMEDASGTQTQQFVWDWIGDEGQPCRVSMRFIDGLLTLKDYRD